MSICECYYGKKMKGKIIKILLVASLAACFTVGTPFSMPSFNKFCSATPCLANSSSKSSSSYCPSSTEGGGGIYGWIAVASSLKKVKIARGVFGPSFRHSLGSPGPIYCFGLSSLDAWCCKCPSSSGVLYYFCRLATFFN